MHHHHHDMSEDGRAQAHDHGALGNSPASSAPSVAAAFADEDGFAFQEVARDVFSADRVFTARFESTNNSGVSADALLLLDGSELKVFVSAEGLEAGLHPLHVHGVAGGEDSRNVTLTEDADGDGFVEVLEGAPAYGPIILNLLTDPDAALDVELGTIRADLPFPATGEDGRLLYAQTFNFDDEDGEFAAAIFDELMPLQNRHLVLHGQSVREGDGEGTGGEVDGTAGYKAALPVANGELVELSNPFAKLVALANLMADQDEMGAMASASADFALGTA